MESTNRILFEKPDIPSLTREFTVADLHFHSRYSDGRDSVEQIAERAMDLGIGLALTDHNDIRGALEMERYPEVMNIPGIEITSREGTHLLVYFYDAPTLVRFYDRSVRPFLGRCVMSATSLAMEDLIERAREFDSVVVFPHPYSAVFTGIYNTHFSPELLRRLMSRVDGVEVLNASILSKWNLRSAVLGFNLGKAVTGGSDGHSVAHLGRAVCCAACSPDARSFLDAVRNRANRVVGKEMDLFRKVTANRHKLRSNIRNYPDIVERNLRYSYLYLNTKSRNVRDNVRRTINDRMDRMRHRD